MQSGCRNLNLKITHTICSYCSWSLKPTSATATAHCLKCMRSFLLLQELTFEKSRGPWIQGQVSWRPLRSRSFVNARQATSYFKPEHRWKILCAPPTSRCSNWQASTATPLSKCTRWATHPGTCAPSHTFAYVNGKFALCFYKGAFGFLVFVYLCVSVCMCVCPRITNINYQNQSLQPSPSYFHAWSYQFLTSRKVGRGHIWKHTVHDTYPCTGKRSVVQGETLLTCSFPLIAPLLANRMWN